LTSDILTLGSVHAEILPWTMSIDFGADSSKAVFRLECGQTVQTDATELSSARRRVYSRRG